jgi:hypothetical protein
VSLVALALDALRAGAAAAASFLEVLARRRWHIGARPTRTCASEICDLHPIAAPARCVCSPFAARRLLTHRLPCRFPRVCSPAKMMENDVARRVRAVGARLPSCPSRARRIGDGRAALGALGALSARAVCRRGRGGHGGAAVGSGDALGGQRAGASSRVWAGWGHGRAGEARGGRRGKRRCIAE